MVSVGVPLFKKSTPVDDGAAYDSTGGSQARLVTPVAYVVAMASSITEPGYRKGQSPASKGKTYPAEVLTPDEVRALLAECSATSSYGLRHRR